MNDMVLSYQYIFSGDVMDNTKFILLNKKMAHKYLKEWKCHNCGYADGEPLIYRKGDVENALFIECPKCKQIVKMSF